MTKILLFGSTGFIGAQLKKALLETGYHVADPRVDVRELAQVVEVIETEKPDYIINATGMTGKPNVDWCEEHSEETYQVNVNGSINIASEAHKRDIKVAQMSSGCVYDGDNDGKGFNEEDEPNFFGSTYSRSRIVSEKALKDFPNVLQLRIRIPVMGTSNPKNLIDKLLKYPEMINRVNSCTVIEDFIPATLKLIELRTTGVMNMCNPGPMDHLSIMQIYKEVVDSSYEPKVMGEADQVELCKRRSNTVMSSERREALGVHMPMLEESLRRILVNYR